MVSIEKLTAKAKAKACHALCCKAETIAMIKQKLAVTMVRAFRSEKICFIRTGLDLQQIASKKSIRQHMGGRIIFHKKRVVCLNNSFKVIGHWSLVISH